MLSDTIIEHNAMSTIQNLELMDIMSKWEAVTLNPAIQDAVITSTVCASFQLLHNHHYCVSRIPCSLFRVMPSIFSVANVADNAMQISTPLWGLY